MPAFLADRVIFGRSPLVYEVMEAATDTYEAQFAHLVSVAHRVARRVVGSSEDAEDIAVEALARAHGRWSRISGYAEPWVVRVATNLALDLVRRGPAPTAAPASPAPDPDDRVVERTAILEGLRRLPRRQREVLALTYLCDLPLADAAQVLGLSVGSIKQHQHRGLAALRRLSPEGGRATWLEAT